MLFPFINSNFNRLFVKRENIQYYVFVYSTYTESMCDTLRFSDEHIFTINRIIVTPWLWHQYGVLILYMLMYMKLLYKTNISAKCKIVKFDII